MIKIGTTNIKGIMLGKTEIVKAYLGTDVVYQNLPYDAEVEYLETDGNAYVNTLIYPTTLDIDIQYEGQSYLSFGWLFDTVANNTWIGCWAGTIYLQNYKNKYKLPSFGSLWAVCRYDMKGGFWKDGVLLQSFTTSLGDTNINTIPLNIFAPYDSNVKGISINVKNFSGKIKWCKIYRRDMLLRDFIPVRVGNVGYMYDKVSGQLFGNAGTGDFILGPDK